MAIAGLLVAAWPLVHGNSPRYWLVVIATLLAIAAQFRPAVLSSLNQAWFRFGLVLHRLTNPLVMAALFYGIITPIAVIFRLLGRNPLDLGYDRHAPTYWIAHPAAEGRPSDMRKQF